MVNSGSFEDILIENVKCVFLFCVSLSFDLDEVEDDLVEYAEVLTYSSCADSIDSGSSLFGFHFLMII